MRSGAGWRECGEGGDEALAGGEDGGGVVFGGVAEILFGRAAGGVGGREATLAGAESGDEPGVRAPGRDGDDAGSRAGQMCRVGEGVSGGRVGCGR